ncbi:MAG: alginate lyase family protein [Alphaproteobacteria bacterium]|nr:alginate lyase family protein [Alphaproteobacteria bacterium]
MTRTELKRIGWYWRRLRPMTPGEVALRLWDRAYEWQWRNLFFARGLAPGPGQGKRPRVFRGGLTRTQASAAPADAGVSLLKCAERLLEGNWQVFAVGRDDATPAVDWHWDPKSGSRVPSRAYSYDIRITGENLPFDTKYVWELSRHHHTTVLAAAYWLTGEVRYAEAAAAHVQSWCRENPFLHGIHWASAIELGIRLTSFVWTRRLLEDWAGCRAAFEDDRLFCERVYQHQWLLARRMSYGSSANNHLISEATGLFAASSSMPWFSESDAWRLKAQRVLEREYLRQIFPSGMSRELATAYHAANVESFFVNVVESELNGAPFSDAFWDVGRRMVDCIADLADCRGRPPRQGDSDDACCVMLDNPGYDRWTDLLTLGAAVFGGAAWWPQEGRQTLRAWFFASILKAGGRHRGAPSHKKRKHCYREGGLAVLRGRTSSEEEIYCAFDVGPLGYLSIAAHAHADALAFELRVEGQQILVDPGTYSYTAPSSWRDYFRSTRAHNTLELGEISQSRSGGPFLWTSAGNGRLLHAAGMDEGAPVATVEGEHDGYVKSLRARHRRRLTLNRNAGQLVIEDHVTCASDVSCNLLFHLHPDVQCELLDNVVTLRWTADMTKRYLQIALPAALSWKAVSGSTDPILGWYSGAYDSKVPSITLIGKGEIRETAILCTTVTFAGESLYHAEIDKAPMCAPPARPQKTGERTL